MSGARTRERRRRRAARGTGETTYGKKDQRKSMGVRKQAPGASLLRGWVPERCRVGDDEAIKGGLTWLRGGEQRRVYASMCAAATKEVSDFRAGSCIPAPRSGK